MGEWFGCCGFYEKCSDELKCLWPVKGKYCWYRQNLEAGRIFYGKNKGKDINLVKQEIEPDPVEINQIYLHCYDRLLSIYSFKRGYTCSRSYELTKEQINRILDEFRTKEIPYSTIIVESECVVDKIEDQNPANSRVIFKIGDTEFSVYNFNDHLIKFKAAENIAKALSAKGIKAESEIVSKVFNKSNNYKAYTPTPSVAPKETRKEPNKKPEYKQVSIFDFGRVG